MVSNFVATPEHKINLVDYNLLYGKKEEPDSQSEDTSLNGFKKKYENLNFHIYFFSCSIIYL